MVVFRVLGLRVVTLRSDVETFEEMREVVEEVASRCGLQAGGPFPRLFS